MRKLLLLILIMIPLVYGIEECQRETKAVDIPCSIITTWNPGTCSDYTVLIYNITGSNIHNYTFGEYPPVCNATFNITTIGTYHYNSSIESGVINVKGDDNMIYLLFIPLGLCFLFIYWANSLNEDQEPLKWFMRFLSFIMIFVVYVGANMIINMNPSYSALQDLFNITVLNWIFFTLLAVFLVYFLYRIFMSFKIRKKDDFERGFIR